MESVAILGASRGLGKALVSEYCERGATVLAVSRSIDQDAYKTLKCDFSKNTEQTRLLRALEEFAPDKIIYCAGGGPFGDFAAKEWKDHQWAWEVSFACAARVVHWALRRGETPAQICLIGSAIAESAPEAGGASYGASKAALKSLYLSLTKAGGPMDLRLYSPGYMDTDLLPPRAWPRRENRLIWSPLEVARDICQWLLTNKKCDHRILTPFKEEVS